MGERPEDVIRDWLEHAADKMGPLYGTSRDHYTQEAIPALDALVAERDRAERERDERETAWNAKFDEAQDLAAALAAERVRADAAEAVVREYAARLAEEGAL